MPGLGFKIVDKDRREIVPIVERAVQEHRPIEVGLSFGDADALSYLESTLSEPDLPVVVHLDHRQFSLMHFPSRAEAVRPPLRQAVRLGARSLITPVAPYPASARPEHQGAVLARIAAGAETIIKEAANEGLAVYLENTYHDLDFYGRLFDDLDEQGQDEIHHCFDIGHAKVWSTGTLGDWLHLLDTRRAKGRRLHFHLHANRGLADEHLSFVRAEELGLTGPDAFCTDGDYWQAISEIDRRFPESFKVFEVPADEALANMELALQHVGDNPAPALDPPRAVEPARQQPRRPTAR